MRTHEQLIADAGGYRALASKVGLPEARVRFWERRKRIPARFWPAVANKRLASLRELVGRNEDAADTPSQGAAA